MRIDLMTTCTRCGLIWEEDYEYCIRCEPVLAQAERNKILNAFDDIETYDKKASGSKDLTGLKGETK